MGGANEGGETNEEFEESRDGGGIEKARVEQWIVPVYITISLYLSLRVCVCVCGFLSHLAVENLFSRKQSSQIHSRAFPTLCKPSGPSGSHIISVFHPLFS